MVFSTVLEGWFFWKIKPEPHPPARAEIEYQTHVKHNAFLHVCGVRARLKQITTVSKVVQKASKWICFTFHHKLQICPYSRKAQCGWAHPEITPAPKKSLKYCKKQWVCKFYTVLPPTRRTPDGPMKYKESIGKYKQNDVKHMVHFLFGNEVWLIKINQIEDCEWTEHIPETHNPLKNTTQTRYREDDTMRQNWWNPCVYQQKVMLHKRSFAVFLRKCTVNPATDYNIFSGRTCTNLWRDLKLLISIS